MNQILEKYKSTNILCAEVLKIWPEHNNFLKSRFDSIDDPTLEIVEDLSTLILKIADKNLSNYIDGYQWTCNALLEEELFFRRNNKYRHDNFSAANLEIYADSNLMEKYLKGLLISQVLWKNQSEAFLFYKKYFLNALKKSSNLLEIGPGHGLLMYIAAQSPGIKSITGWDVSEASLKMTKATLESVGLKFPINLRLKNILEDFPREPFFDAIVMSEVLEHLEDPSNAIRVVYDLLRPEGVAYFNMPINSPAPDHIYLCRSALEVEDLVRGAGFKIKMIYNAPATGLTVSSAIKRKATINVLILASKI